MFCLIQLKAKLIGVLFGMAGIYTIILNNILNKNKVVAATINKPFKLPAF